MNVDIEGLPRATTEALESDVPCGLYVVVDGDGNTLDAEIADIVLGPMPTRLLARVRATGSLLVPGVELITVRPDGCQVIYQRTIVQWKKDGQVLMEAMKRS